MSYELHDQCHYCGSELIENRCSNGCYNMRQRDIDQLNIRTAIAAAVTVICTTSQPPVASEDECQHFIKIGINDTTEICVACRKRMVTNSAPGITITGSSKVGGIPIPLTAQPTDRAVEIGSDGLCRCSGSDPCPLGRVGSEYRCTEQELIDAGVRTVRTTKGAE